MSNSISFPGEGITQLIVEELARDAVVRGVTDATAIQVSYEPFARDTAPAFVQEGAAVRFARSAAYRIHLPDGVGLVAARTGGDLRVQGVTGDIDLGTVRGDLRLDSLAGRRDRGRGERRRPRRGGR